MEFTEVIIILSLISGLAAVAGLVYCICKIKELERVLKSIPDPYEVFDEKMKLKIPLIMGPDGMPMIPKTGKMKAPDYMG